MATPADSDSLGGRIRRLRQERGYSLAKVAGADFSRAFLNQVELGRSQPSTRVLRVIAARLGTGLEYLVEGEPAATELALAVERGRLAVAAAQHQRALRELAAALDAGWPEGSDARVTKAAALIGLGRRAEADGLLEQEAAAIAERGDQLRLQRVERIRKGGSGAFSAAEHLRLAEQALRAGHDTEALEHYRAARLLLEAPPD